MVLPVVVMTPQFTCLKHMTASPRDPHALPSALSLRSKLAPAVLVASASLPLLLGAPANASIPLQQPNGEDQRARALAQLGGQYAAAARAARQAPAPALSVGEQIQQALALLQQAREAADQGQYAEALASYDALLAAHRDLALAEYARLERALVLYQLGDVRQCLLALEDEEVALRGAAGVHAALAAVVYAERPSQISLAEEQWEIAMEFDRRYADPDWVRQQKHWPPRAVGALQRFLQLT